MNKYISVIAATLSISLLTSGCLLFGTYESKNDKDDSDKEHKTLSQLIDDITGAGPEPAGYVDPADPTDPSSADPTQGIGISRTPMRSIADDAWAAQGNYLWKVSTPEQFAGVVKYLNEHTGQYLFAEIYLDNDLDLDDYNWEPINDFTGNIDGRGHTISNIHLVNPDSTHNGLIGANGGAIGVFNLNVENAEVIGGIFAGIIVAEGYMMNFVNVYASGRVESDGEFVGALIGRTSPSMTYDGCSMNVEVNHALANYYSYTQENEAHAEMLAQEIYTLTLKDDHTVVRDDVDHDSRNLGWRVIYNDQIVLERNAEDELEYKYFRSDPGTYEIYLTEFNSDFYGYVRVSNIVRYVIE